MSESDISQAQLGLSHAYKAFIKFNIHVQLS